jgi:hypothetical protein
VGAVACSWRDRARKVIEPIYIVCRALDMPVDVYNKRVSDAYPFGQREMHPYKIWLDECKRWRQQYEMGRVLLTGFIPGPRPGKAHHVPDTATETLPGLD